MDELLKPLVSLSLFGIFAYAVGIVLTEGNLSRSVMLVPRRRRDRYIIRSVSFLEFVFGIILIVATGVLYEQTKSKASLILLAVSFGLLFLKFLILIISLERIQEFHRKNRLDSKVGSLLIIAWLALSFVLLRHATTESERTLSWVLIAYVFFIVVFLKANLTHTYIHVIVDLKLKSGVALDGQSLLDETSDFFVLAAEAGSNVLIPKGEVASAKVWLEEKPVVVVEKIAR